MAGTEGPKIPPNTERPQGLRHKEILDRFDPVATDPAFDAAAVYWQAKSDWMVGLDTFRQRMNAAIAEAWEGRAAEASKAAINAYTSKAEGLTNSFETVARLIGESAMSASNTKSQLPARKSDPGIFDVNDRWINNDEFERKRADDEEDARAVMTSQFVNRFKTIDESLPVLDHPTMLVDDSYVPSGMGKDGDHGSGGGDTGPNHTDDNETTEDTTSEDDSVEETPPDEDATDDATEDDSTTDDGDGDDSDIDDDSDDSDTTPSSTTPAATGPSTTPEAGKPTTPGTPGSPGSGGPTGGGPAVSGGPGRSISGSPSVLPVAPVAAGTSGAAGRAGTTGPGMMGAPGVGRSKDDESTHKTPDYLISEQNTRDLIGELDRSAPPAIGAHFPSAQVRSADDEGDPV
ncbi:WXG100 family type VII secretion target [Nocardia thailandica]